MKLDLVCKAFDNFDNYLTSIQVQILIIFFNDDPSRHYRKTIGFVITGYSNYDFCSDIQISSCNLRI